MTPSRKVSAGRRDLPLPAGAGKGCNINFVSARLVRTVGDPPAVRRNLAIGLAELRLQERKRLSISGQRQDKQIAVSRRPEAFVKNKFAVRRPAVGIFVEIVLQQRFFTAGPAGGLLIQVQGTLPA